MLRNLTKRDWIFLGLLTAAAAALRFAWLGHPGQIIFDETYFANFAYNYLTGTKFFDAEPPLAKFIIAGGEWLFGSNPRTLEGSFGWRFMSALFGTAVIPLMYLLVKRLFGGTFMPLVAAFLALLDGLLLVESRTAVIDIFVVFFNLLTYLLFIRSLQAKTHKASFLFLAATGVSLGLGLAVKWITLAFVGPAIVLLLILGLSRRKRVQKIFKLRSRKALFDALGARPQNLHHPLTYLLFLGVVPTVLYLILFALHVPYDTTGQGIWGIHQQIFNYHHNLKATHPYGSAWYTWPLNIRPVAYYFESGDRYQTIVALGNPLIWWPGAAALVYGLYRFTRSRNILLGLILFAFLAHFLPWAFIPRVLFIYHYMGGLPFMLIALAYTLHRVWRARTEDTLVETLGWVAILGAAGTIGGLLLRSLLGDDNPTLVFALGSLLATGPLAYGALTPVRGLRSNQRLVVAYLVVATLAFIFFLPIWTGMPLDPADYYRHMWLKSWI